MGYNNIRNKIKKFDGGGTLDERGNFRNPLIDPSIAIGGYATGALGGYSAASNFEGMVSGIDYLKESGDSVGGALQIGGSAMATVGNIVDQQTMSNKNFSAASQAADQLVHGTSEALLKSGNPYCVCAGTKVYTPSGYINIEDISVGDRILGYYNKESIFEEVIKITPPHYKECLEIETEQGNTLKCSTDHPILSAKKGRAIYKTVRKKKQRRIKDYAFIPACGLKIGDFIAEIGEIPYFGNKHVKDAYLIGMLIGDGTYGKKHTPRLFSADPDTWKFVEDNYKLIKKKVYLPGNKYNKEFREYSFFGFQSVLREHQIYGQTKQNKKLPSDIELWDKQSISDLIAGLIDTDGCVQSSSSDHSEIIFYQTNKELLLEVKRLLLKFGIHSYIRKFKKVKTELKNRTIVSKTRFSLTIKKRVSVINFYNNIKLNIGYKQEALQKAFLNKISVKDRDTSFEFYKLVGDKIKRIEYIGLQFVYNIEVSGSHTYIANNIVTHNCALAGVALEVGNFATKAGGNTVEGYNVNIDNSGYGSIGSMNSTSSRGFFGIGSKSAEKKLKRRNQQLRMALNAAEISDEQSFMNEARGNNIQNIIQNNQIALAGGLETSNLGG